MTVCIKFYYQFNPPNKKRKACATDTHFVHATALNRAVSCVTMAHKLLLYFNEYDTSLFNKIYNLRNLEVMCGTFGSKLQSLKACRKQHSIPC